MSVLKFIECWWYSRHLPMLLTRDGKRSRVCARCGVTL